MSDDEAPEIRKRRAVQAVLVIVGLLLLVSSLGAYTGNGVGDTPLSEYNGSDGVVIEEGESSVGIGFGRQARATYVGEYAYVVAETSDEGSNRYVPDEDGWSTLEAPASKGTMEVTFYDRNGTEVANAMATFEVDDSGSGQMIVISIGLILSALVLELWARYRQNDE